MIENLRFYLKAMELYDLCWNDCSILMKDYRGKEIASQLIRSVGSVSANIEEGAGRGYGKEYPQFLRISRGSALESKGWYQRSKFLLPPEIITERIEMLNQITGAISKTIVTLENRKKNNR
jgi:four helix bundle protein